MKKTFTTALVMIITVLCMVSCGGSKSSQVSNESRLKNEIHGYWYDTDSAFLYAFEDDEYLFASLSDNGQNNITVSGTYDIKGNSITLHSDGNSDIVLNEVTVKGDTLSFVSSTGARFEFDRLPEDVVKELIK